MADSVITLNDVFGVSNNRLKSYVERKNVDSKIKKALQSDRQIVVYGASKQGKTALVSTYISYDTDKSIIVRLSPNSDLATVYHSILRQAGILLETSYTSHDSKETKSDIKAKIKSAVALFLVAEAGVRRNEKRGTSVTKKYQEVPFNLELAQDVGELLIKIKNDKFIILENFHYLSEEMQRQFSYDLRTFQEMGIRFIILGVWREKDRMSQYNGDLLDRVEEIAVEPWHNEDFQKIALTGSEVLNVFISQEIIERCANASFGSVGVFQELMKEVCVEAGVSDCMNGGTKIDN